MGTESYDVEFVGSKLLFGFDCMNNKKCDSSFIPVGVDLNDEEFKEIHKDLSGMMKCDFLVGDDRHSMFFTADVMDKLEECCALTEKYGFDAFMYQNPKNGFVGVYGSDGKLLKAFGSDGNFDKADYLDACVFLVEQNIGKPIEFESWSDWVVNNKYSSLVAHHFNDKFVTGWKTAICRYDGDSAMEEQS